MNVIYYCEVKLICIIILVLFKSQLGRKFAQLSSENRVFNLLITASIVLCFSDMLAGICRGQFFFGARAIIQISNLVFYEALALISYLWMLYTFVKLKVISRLDKRVVIWAIPLIIFSLIALSNPVTNLLFSINENNLYVRGGAIYLHWIVTWLYLVVATIQVGKIVLREKSPQRRNEVIPLLYFIIAPIIAGLLQMFFYGITSSQVGVTISIVIISLVEHKNQILTDSLTGLNNRNGFNKFLENYVIHNCGEELFVLVIDLDDFKQVNDKFGHMAGDRALIETADALRQVCSQSKGRLFACRYGGDEFLIAGCECTQGDMEDLQNLIHKALDDKNKSGNNPYRLAASIGMSGLKCSSVSDVSNLMRMADEAMYVDKKRMKA